MATSEFLRFLNRIERTIPAGTAIHAILDNYATHKHAACGSGWRSTRAGPSTSPRPRARGSTPGGRLLSWRRLKRGVFAPSANSRQATQRFIDEHNITEAKPFSWIADPESIIAARKRGFQTLESID